MCEELRPFLNFCRAGNLCFKTLDVDFIPAGDYKLKNSFQNQQRITVSAPINADILYFLYL